MRNDPRRIFGLGPFGVFGLALLMTSSLLAAVDDSLALVPEGAAAVGVVRLVDLRTNPLSSRLFRDFDRNLADGDAARFLEEANLDPKKDVDVIMVAGSPKGSGHGEGLIVFQGRFEPERLSAAAVLRGAVRKSTPDGPYFLLPDKRKGKDEEGEAAHRHEPGAVAFVNARLVMAGPELSVKKALADLSAGGTGFLKGDGIGKERGRIDRKAAIWALADASRLPDREPRKGAGDAVQGLAAAMRSVTFLTFQAVPKEDGMTFSLTGLSPSGETRDNLEDALRGILAVWRMAAQEKHPDLVAVLRKFRVEKGKDGVTVSGLLPAAVMKSLGEKEKEKK